MGVAGRQHGAPAALRQRQVSGRGQKFCVFIGSDWGRVRGGSAEEGVNLSEILNASMCHSEVSLELGHSGLEDKDFVFCCRRLRSARGAGDFAGIFLKPVFSLVEGHVGCFVGFEFEGAHAGRGAGLAISHPVHAGVQVRGEDRGRSRCEEKDFRSS